MTRPGVVLLITMTLFMVYESALSQTDEKRFHQLTLRDGLSQSRVQAIHQDTDGYVWFGTADGLNRFDGYEFTVFRTDPDVPGSIGDNFIEVIYKDKEGTLWIGTHTGGLMKYQPETETFRAFRGIMDEWGWATLSANMVQSMLEDSRGNFWVGTGYGLNLMNREAGTFRRLIPDNEEEPSPNGLEINELYECSLGVLWIGSEYGLEYYDYDSSNFYSFNGFENMESPVRFGTIQAIYEDSEGILWIGSDGNGLFAIDFVNEVITQYVNEADVLNSISGSFRI